MKDMPSILKAEEAKARDLIAKTFGPSVDFQAFSEVAQSLFPSPIRELQSLCIFYENEMIRCRDAKAYFSACLAGAAMIESFLLLLSVLERTDVERTTAFQQFSKTNQPYENAVLGWTLKHLIPVTEELEWIRHTVDEDLVAALTSAHNEIAPIVRPGITPEEVATGAAGIKAHPDTAFLGLMQSMRNLVHAGRCVRLKKNLGSEDFADWAKLVTVLTVEIRDCLILRLKATYRQHFMNLMNSPMGLDAIIKLLNAIGKLPGDNPVSPSQAL